MGLSVFTGSLTQPSGTGSQSYSGVGFQPKVVLFWPTIQTASASGADSIISFGAAVSSSSRAAGCVRQADANAGRGVVFESNVACIGICGISNYAEMRAVADFTSMDSDGFTLNWSTVADSTARVVNYLALGGTDITNVTVGTETTKTTTGTKATEGLGFQPTCLLLFNPRSWTSATEQGAGYLVGHAGFSTGASASFSSGFYDPGTGPTDTKRYQSTSNLFARISDTLDIAATLSSFDADGFTLNYSATIGVAVYFYYIAIKGPNVKVGSFNQETSTGNKDTTGIGFQPSVLFLQSVNAASSGSINTNMRFSQGIGTSSSARFSVWAGDTHNANPAVRSNDFDSTKIIKMMTEAGATPTTDAAADLVSLDSDGFTLNWTTADGTAREIGYLAIGAAAGAATPINATMSEDMNQ